VGPEASPPDGKPDGPVDLAMDLPPDVVTVPPDAPPDVPRDMAPAQPPGSPIWIKQLKAMFIDGVALSGSDIVAVGSFGGTVNLGGSDLKAVQGSDGLLARFRKEDGAHLMSRSFGSTGDEFPYGIAVAADGSVVIQGVYFNGPANLGGAELPFSGGPGLDILVGGYTSSFAHRWSRKIGGNDDDQTGVTGTALDVDINNGAVITGKFRNTVDFGAGPVTAMGDSDAFFVRYDPTGTPVRVALLASTAYEQGDSVTSVLGNSVVAGAFSATIQLQEPPALQTKGGMDIFVAALSPTTKRLWQLQLGGPGDDFSSYLTHDSAGNVYLAGTFQQSLVVAGKTLMAKGGSDIILARISPAGTVDWATSFGGPGNDAPRGFASSPTGDLVVVGEFQGSIEIGGGMRNSRGMIDGFVAAFDGRDGSYRWDHTYGDGLHDRAVAVAVDGSGESWVSVDFQGTVDFGMGPLTAASGFDTALIRFSR
jgi:hypothetical protein